MKQCQQREAPHVSPLLLAFQLRGSTPTWPAQQHAPPPSAQARCPAPRPPKAVLVGRWPGSGLLLSALLTFGVRGLWQGALLGIVKCFQPSGASMHLNPRSVVTTPKYLQTVVKCPLGANHLLSQVRVTALVNQEPGRHLHP